MAFELLCGLLQVVGCVRGLKVLCLMRSAWIIVEKKVVKQMIN